MEDKITGLHKVVLWFSIITCFLFGVSQYLVPSATTDFLKVNAPDPVAISCIGGFLIAALVGSVFSLKSGSWKEVRIPTYYLMTWSLLNGMRLAIYIITNSDTSLLPNCISCLVIGIGFAIVVCKRNCSPKNKTA